MNQPLIVKISSVKEETKMVKTITFPYKKKTVPGQFFMVWIPGVDEIPMSVSMIDDELKAITFKVVGKATEVLFQLVEDDKIGIRGPYGNGFSFQGTHHLFIGGGTGIAMIAPAVESCVSKQYKIDVILGAKSKNELFFVNRLQKTNMNIHLTTDDGTIGFKGYASDYAKALINKKSVDTVYTCGPEFMMKSLFDFCFGKQITLQASLERYMKCAMGICGSCCIGEGLRVCVEGPVFTDEQLRGIDDFGLFTRTSSGKKRDFIN
jgi:dihydroorotate dehydrogenase electron transfer subunit